MPMYFEDFYEGYSFVTGKRKLSREELISFARQWDYQSFHVDPNMAKKTKFKGLIASGWHTLLVAFTLILDTQPILNFKNRTKSDFLGPSFPGPCP